MGLPNPGMLILTITSTLPGTRSAGNDHHRAAPAVLFLDYDPILPDWPVPDDAGDRGSSGEIFGGTGAAQKGVQTCATRSDLRS